MASCKWLYVYGQSTPTRKALDISASSPPGSEPPNEGTSCHLSMGICASAFTKTNTKNTLLGKRESDKTEPHAPPFDTPGVFPIRSPRTSLLGKEIGPVNGQDADHVHNPRRPIKDACTVMDPFRMLNTCKELTLVPGTEPRGGKRSFRYRNHWLYL